MIPARLYLALAFVARAPTDVAGPCHFEIPTVPAAGLPAAGTGARQVFNPDSYAGTDYAKLQSAIDAAVAVNGAVVLSRYYEYAGVTPTISGPVLITGGGLRRACSPQQQITANVLATDTCVTVPTPSAYSTVSVVYLFFGNAYNQQRGGFTISSITATQVCSAGQLGFAATAGDTLAGVNSLLTTLSGGYIDGIIVDSVAFDGQSGCNAYTNDWRYNDSLVIRADTTGGNVVRNSYFFDTPSENMTICGGVFTNNIAWDLSGSFVHKSCDNPHAGLVDTLTGNRVSRVNLVGDATMNHSEGLFTFSANSGHVRSNGNKYLNGQEAVFGNASDDSPDVRAYGDCYSQFRRLLGWVPGTDLSTLAFDAVVDRVPERGRQ